MILMPDGFPAGKIGVRLGLGRNLILLIAAATASMLLWIFFLNASGVTLSGMMDISALEANAKLLMQPAFIIFLITFPIPLALLALMCRAYNRNAMRGTALASFAIASLIAVAAFGNIFLHIFEFAILGVFYLIALMLMIESAKLGFEEAKKYTLLRALNSAAGRAVTIAGIGVLATALLIAVPNQQFYTKQFDSLVLGQAGTAGSAGSSGAGGAGSNANDLAAIAADAYISMQKQQLQQITSSGQYLQLLAKDDADVQQFVMLIAALEVQLNSEEYRNEVIAQIKEREDALQQGAANQAAGAGVAAYGQGAAGQFNVLEIARQRFPLFGLMEKYMWLIASFGVSSAFLFFGSFVIRPLAILYGLVLGAVWKQQNRQRLQE